MLLTIGNTYYDSSYSYIVSVKLRAIIDTHVVYETYPDSDRSNLIVATAKDFEKRFRNSFNEIKIVSLKENIKDLEEWIVKQSALLNKYRYDLIKLEREE